MRVSVLWSSRAWWIGPHCGVYGDQSEPILLQHLTEARVRRYLTYMKTRISSKGQIVLPAEFRQMDRIEPGQEFDVERLDRGDYRLLRRVAPRNEGAIDWLLACPHQDFFVPIDSESTDTL
jgi:bifunctional DNA-binding transcriptional regulator/antitoxin component of YhaV-PrlF toxin-antitoxin module